MVSTLFAHTGHSHDVPATPWWQDGTAISTLLVVGFAGMLIAAHFLKAKPSLKITLAMVYLLGVGVFCYSLAPALSIVSLTLGFALAMVTTFLQLSIQKQPPQK